MIEIKKFLNYITAVFFVLITLVSYARPSSAIPAEYGKAAANVAQEVVQNLTLLGDVVGNFNLQPPIPNNAAQIGCAGRVNFNPNINQPNLGQNGMLPKTNPTWLTYP